MKLSINKSGNSSGGVFNNTSGAREPPRIINRFNMYLKVRGKTQLDQKPYIRVPESPYYNFPMRPSGKGDLFDLGDLGDLVETPVLPSFDKLPPMEPVFDKWPTFETPVLPPRASGFPTAMALSAVVGAVVVLMIIAGICRGKASRTRRGRVMGAGAVQQGRPSVSTDQPSVPNYPRQPSKQGEQGRPLNSDLPPPYYECTPSSINEYVSDNPPPYANYKDAELQVHARRQTALIGNGLRAKSITMTTTSQ